VSVVRGAVSRCSGVVEVVAGRVERFRRREERTQLVARLQATSQSSAPTNHVLDAVHTE